jgi:hypothetical protein
MRLQVDWGKPVPMRRDKVAGYILDLEKLPDHAGVYVFGRRWGNSYEALYVGKALRIRSRVKGQLNNLRLISHIRTAKVGSRVVMTGVVVTKPGQQIDKCITLVERSLIRYFLSEGHDLVNIMGTALRQHEIVSAPAPRWFVPSSMFLDKGR